MRDDIAGMNANPHMEPGIIQELDAAHQLQTGLAGHDGMIVVGVRRTEQRDQAIAAFLADDAAVAPDRYSHGVQGRFKPRDRGFGIELRDQVGRALQIGTKDGEVLPLPHDPVANVGDRFGRMVRHDRATGRTIEVASLDVRRTDLAEHPQLPPTIHFRVNERSWRNKHLGPLLHLG